MEIREGLCSMTKEQLYKAFKKKYDDHDELYDAFLEVIAPHLPDVILSKDEKEFEDWYNCNASSPGYFYEEFKEVWMAARGK